MVKTVVSVGLPVDECLRIRKQTMGPEVMDGTEK